MRTANHILSDITFLKYEIRQARAFNEGEKEMEYLYSALEELIKELNEVKE